MSHVASHKRIQAFEFNEGIPKFLLLVKNTRHQLGTINDQSDMHRHKS